jgi:hypothetical protein
MNITIHLERLSAAHSAEIRNKKLEIRVSVLRTGRGLALK